MRQSPRRCGVRCTPCCFEVGQAQAPPALRAGRRCLGWSTRSRIAQHAVVERQLRRRAGAGRSALRRAGARSARTTAASRRSIRSRKPLAHRRGNRGLVGRAADLGLLARRRAGLRPTRNVKPGGACGVSAPQQLVGGVAVRPVPIPSLRRVPSMPTARAKGNVIRGLG